MFRNRPFLQMACVGIVGVAILLPICLFVIPWWPADASKQASNVHTLYDVLLIATVPIFVLVVTVVVFSVWKFRMKPGEEEKDGPPIHGNTRLEVVWTAIPAVLILGMCLYAYTVLRSNEDSQPGEMTVNVTARQFAFEFSYPHVGLQPDRLAGAVPAQGPAGRVQAPLAGRDPQLLRSAVLREARRRAGDHDHAAGHAHANRNLSRPNAPSCAAPGHSLMRATVYVVSPTAFQAWLSSQKPNGTAAGRRAPRRTLPSRGSRPAARARAPRRRAPSATSAAAGKTIFTGVGTCGACHTLAAAGTTGTVGPNLTQRLASDCATPASMKIRGKTLTECIHTAITDPYAYIPTGFHSGIMPPNFSPRLGSNDIQALVNYLASVTK